MKVHIAYGESSLEIKLPENITTVIEPKYKQGIEDEKAVLWHSLNKPIEALTLRNWFNGKSKICITFTNITRPTPNIRLIP